MTWSNGCERLFGGETQRPGAATVLMGEYEMKLAQLAEGVACRAVPKPPATDGSRPAI
jgi:hypothetical protein